MKALEVRNLKKNFRSNFLIRTYKVLKAVNLNVEQGQIYGFLGPNGAGKTTTIKCILGLTRPDSGEILIHDQPADSVRLRQILGFLPENPFFYDYLNAEELLHFSGQLFALPGPLIRQRTRELLRRVGLEGKEHLKLRKFSKGMLQRVGLAQALIQDPELLILDEPFSGLDPIGRKELRDLILELKEQGKTIFFSSHILQDAEMIVDRVGIILNGTIIREGLLHELVSHEVQYVEIVCSGLSEAAVQRLGSEVLFKNGQHILRVEVGDAVQTVSASILSQGGRLTAVTPVKLTLEDIFLRELRELQESACV